MLKFVRQTMLCVAAAAALVPLPSLNAQKTPETPAAPVPAQILTAKKVFISNAGVDANAVVGDRDEAYNQFYQAMKTWGRYELVTAPADADLVFEISFAAPLISTQVIDTYATQFDVVILDTKTHFNLWTIKQSVQRAARKETWNKNFSKGIADLMDSIKSLTAPPAASPAAK